MSRVDALLCDTEKRRERVRASRLNGLDFVEVDPKTQTLLTVTFLGKAPKRLEPGNLVLGEEPQAREVTVTRVLIHREDDPDLDDHMLVFVDRPGDFSTYRLAVVEMDENGCPTETPLAGFDPRHAVLDVRFKLACDAGLDCKAVEVCPPEARAVPEISYLAKDYASFRRLLLDRLALTVPEWQERHVPDLGITLVELLAYHGEKLSYYQDAVATEAYLATARKRVSVRRHVRLVDYRMHEGANARTFLWLETTAPKLEVEAGKLRLLTRFPGAPAEDGLLDERELGSVAETAYEVFLPMAAVTGEELVLREAHNVIPFYTWGDAECCLPRGTTRATLLDGWEEVAPEIPDPGQSYPNDPAQSQLECKPEPEPPPRKRRLDLAVGDFLIFEEVMDPQTGHPGDADPSHRQAVRLTRVEPTFDPLDGTPIVEIEWGWEDALSFPLCLSTVLPEPKGEGECRNRCVLTENVSVAHGNVLPADHGRPVAGDLGVAEGEETRPRCLGEGRPTEVEVIALPFTPRLPRGPLVFAEPVAAGASAARLLAQDPREALPALLLDAQPPPPDGAPWQPRYDLLASGPEDPHFAVEVAEDGRGTLRFGDGQLGRRPDVGTRFQAIWRLGGGKAGNVGAGSIRFVLPGSTLSGVTLVPHQPLPAVGGVDPEPVEEVRMLAPHAFRTRLERAIVAQDYAAIVQRDFAGRVQRAAATLAWTGMETEVLVAVDVLGGQEDPALLAEIAGLLERYRRIGHEVRVVAARHVPLLVGVAVCVAGGYLKTHVAAEILAVLGRGTLPDGRRGLFHPDELSFGQGIAASRLVAAVAAVEGVESARLTLLERQFEGPNGELAAGFLALAPMEIARLENDPRFPDHGRLELALGGGR
ncbi:MAG TPA: putative baseplate assembly protein [Thermoanaerobaculia bacterium]|nr:putative baseplate assembly protein [Thermoanaerobaculia bacterium]